MTKHKLQKLLSSNVNQGYKTKNQGNETKTQINCLGASQDVFVKTG